jgi:hypothetical protein
LTSSWACGSAKQFARGQPGDHRVHPAGGEIDVIVYLRLQCEGPLSFIVSVEDLDSGTPAAPTALDVHEGAA